MKKYTLLAAYIYIYWKREIKKYGLYTQKKGQDKENRTGK